MIDVLKWVPAIVLAFFVFWGFFYYAPLWVVYLTLFLSVIVLGCSPVEKTG